MLSGKVLLLALMVVVVAGCATGVKRPLPGCPDTAERRSINPLHWPPKAPVVAPPAGSSASGEGAPPATHSAPDAPSSKLPWWRRLWSQADRDAVTWECEARRHE